MRSPLPLSAALGLVKHDAAGSPEIQSEKLLGPRTEVSWWLPAMWLLQKAPHSSLPLLLSQLFPLAGTLFPPHSTPPWCLVTCFPAVRFYLLGHFFREAHPDHPDAPAPQSCTCRSRPQCTMSHPPGPPFQHISVSLACPWPASPDFPASGFAQS